LAETTVVRNPLLEGEKGYGYQSLGVDFVEMSAISEIRNGGSVLAGAGDPSRTSSAIEPFQSLGSL
jgi:hypothetical protein